MFQKENSIQRRGGGGKNKKAMDVPLRKSDRRSLRQRAGEYFAAAAAGAASEESKNLQLDSLLDATFLHGNLSVRSLPLLNTEGNTNKAWTMNLYLKTPSNETSDDDHNDHADSSNATDGVDGHHHIRWPYQTTSQFVWMSMEEKHKIVKETPTVALWAVVINYISSVEPYQVTVPYEVSKYICRGADLMTSGMRSLPTKIANNSINNRMVAITVQGNKQPFAVGCLTDTVVSSGVASIGVGTKGVGVEIWNTYGDDIWRYSNHSTNKKKESQQHGTNVNAIGGNSLSFDNGHYGNVGFVDGKYVLPIVGAEEDDEPQPSKTDETDQQPTEPKTAWDEENDGNDKNEGVASETVVDGEENKAAAESEEGNADGNASPPADTSVAPEPAATPEPTPDDLFHQVVCQALVSLNNKEYPILVSTFYAQYVKPSPGGDIDLKATSYKKFGNYIKLQVQNDLLLVGRDKKNPKNNDPNACILGYNKKHDDVVGLTKQPKPTTTSGAGSADKAKLVLVDLYVIPANIVSLLQLAADDVMATNATSEERRGTGMLTSPEVRKILEAYIQREELISKQRQDQIQLNGPLTDVLYKNNPNPPMSILRKDSIKLFTSKLSKAYAIVEMPGSKITKLAKGTPPTINIEVSMRQSKKFVTRVRNLEEYNIDPIYFMKDVIKRISCSGTYETDETLTAGRPALKKKGRVELVFQGNLVDEMESLLTGDESISTHGGVKNSEYCVPSKVLDITLKKGVKPRNNRRG